VEIQTMRGYSLFALGRPVDLRKTVVATRFSQNPRPNAPDSVRNAGVFCSFLALVLRKELEERLTAARLKPEWRVRWTPSVGQESG
jgi:hypothetical protein